MAYFPHYKQNESKDCGPTCLKIIAKHYGKNLNISSLRDLSENTRAGSSLRNLSSAAEKIGFRTIAGKVNLETLKNVELPAIIHWNNNHFVVVYGFGQKSLFKKDIDTVRVSDPAQGLLKYSEKDFLNGWIGNNASNIKSEGVVLLLEPTKDFYNTELESEAKERSLNFLTTYLYRYKKFIFQLILGLLLGSLLQLIFPFLTQSLVDIGIRYRDQSFIYIILLAQLFLFLGRTAIEIIRSWILLHLSTRINISLISDFFIKLMNLQISYFDSRMTGDILQRISDHRRIERLLTTSSLNVLFSLVNLFVFGMVLAFYSWSIFGVFIAGSLFYFIWIYIFLEKRKKLDYLRFQYVSKEQSKIIELINGMQEIKLHNSERQKRWSWEYIQVQIFNISVKELSLEQRQTVGSNFINELKNIIITVLAAKLVIDGEMTLGMMLAISYIVGQLNSPISQLVNFIHEFQDARISFERLAEIHNLPNEDEENAEKVTQIPLNLEIKIEDLVFHYKGGNFNVLDDITLTIPANKTTAIVGGSGSGKTTLMKLILKFYEPNSGNMKLGNINMKNISHEVWREKCGVVMQEGHIFNDSIANNIALGQEHVDKTKLGFSVELANLKEFIESLPLSYNTKIGSEGMGLSTGQKQRILIARAIYKDPEYIFLDEATSALDANNEKQITENLQRYLNRKTVIVIAHRLSTVKNADQIIVMESGRIIEIGAHQSLIERRGRYFDLVKNQLEIGV